MGMSDVMRAKRQALGMSQSRLAEIVGVTSRQIARYEAEEQQPVLSVAAAIAAALEVPLADLAGAEEPLSDLQGTWWTGWQNVSEDRSRTSVEELHVAQHKQTVRLIAEYGSPIDQGRTDWRCDLRLWHNQVLIGWFHGPEETVESKGTVYLTLDDEATTATGRWVGLDQDGAVVSGLVSLARSPEQARRLVADLLDGTSI
ncbi:MAG: helix-turn-helix transcriptional regulator [Actinomycetia bacterium]|nr:helix-turn-helix transcriptional regulator [Actinomycetes bacterium]